jgi:hypothetical protein
MQVLQLLTEISEGHDKAFCHVHHVAEIWFSFLGLNRWVVEKGKTGVVRGIVFSSGNCLFIREWTDQVDGMEMLKCFCWTGVLVSLEARGAFVDLSSRRSARAQARKCGIFSDGPSRPFPLSGPEMLLCSQSQHYNISSCM